MKKGSIKTICFFTRRYDDLLHIDVFDQKFFNQYFWVKHLNKNKYKIIWIFGAQEERKVDHELGSIYFIPDNKRTKLQLQKKSFYKSTIIILEKEKGDVVLANGMNDIASHYYLFRQLSNKENATPIVVQDHATVYRKKYSLVSKFFKPIEGFIFNSPGQETEWINANLFNKSNVHFLPEGVSQFQATDKKSALQKTKLEGSPICLWVGNLVKLKDPFTSLKAIKEVVKVKPSLSLYMIYQKEDLKSEIENYIEINKLKDNVFLLGQIEHSDIEAYFQSADYFISSSIKEGSGYAAIEAMACNTIPILSDIPSFAHFTKNGEIGCMFKQGDHIDMKEKLLQLTSQKKDLIKQKVEKHYNTNFSPTALAQKFETCINTILDD